jgi:hypothetical protein
MAIWVVLVVYCSIISYITELCRAHTPRTASASCSGCICRDQETESCSSMLVDDLYLHRFMMLSYAHEQKYTGVQLIGVANKMQFFTTLVGLTKVLRPLRCAYKSLRCLDLEIWRFLCPQTTDDGHTDCFTPCHACTCGIITAPSLTIMLVGW